MLIELNYPCLLVSHLVQQLQFLFYRMFFRLPAIPTEKFQLPVKVQDFLDGRLECLTGIGEALQDGVIVHLIYILAEALITGDIFHQTK
jgi:hypothetical protein